MDDENNFVPLTDDESVDAANGARVLATTFNLCGYPPAVAENLKLTFRKLAGPDEWYTMQIEAVDRSFEDSVYKRDPAAYTLYYIGRVLRGTTMNIEGTPFVMTQCFQEPIRGKTGELTRAVMKLAPNLIPRFGNGPEMK